MDDPLIAPIDIVFGRARVPRSALDPDHANPNPDVKAILATLLSAFGAPPPPGAGPWRGPHRSQAWHVATREIARHQDDAHFRAALDAAALAMGSLLRVDKAEMPLALLACALTCPDSSARAERVRLALDRRELWSAYPQTDEPTARAFREAATTQLVARLLKTSASFGCEGDLLTPAARLLAGEQDAAAWARIGSAAGASMKGSSQGAPWSRIPKAALLGLPAPFWIAAQRRLSSTTTCWRLIDETMRERAPSEPALGLSIWGSALLALSPREVERCELDYPRWSQEQRLAEVAAHLAGEPQAREDLAARAFSASSRASTHAIGLTHHKRGGGLDVYHWVDSLSAPELMDFFRDFEVGCQIQLSERDAKQARHRESTAQYLAQQAASDARVAALLSGRVSPARPDLDPGRPARRVVPWTRQPGSATNPPGGWDAVVESLDAVIATPWPGAASEPETPVSLAKPLPGAPASAFDVPLAELGSPLLPIGAGRWLHLDRSESERELRLSQAEALAEFSSHARAQAYAMTGRAQPSPKSRTRPGAC